MNNNILKIKGENIKITSVEENVEVKKVFLKAVLYLLQLYTDIYLKLEKHSR